MCSHHSAPRGSWISVQLGSPGTALARIVPWAELRSQGRGGAQQPWLQAGDGLIPWRCEGLLLATLLGLCDPSCRIFPLFPALSPS